MSQYFSCTCFLRSFRRQSAFKFVPPLAHFCHAFVTLIVAFGKRALVVASPFRRLKCYDHTWLRYGRPNFLSTLSLIHPPHSPLALTYDLDQFSSCTIHQPPTPFSASSDVWSRPVLFLYDTPTGLTLALKAVGMTLMTPAVARRFSLT